MLGQAVARVRRTAGPIVGREAELGAARGGADGLGRGRAGVPVASRASRASARRACSRELRERAERAATSSWPAPAAEFERDLPFGVWVDALDAYVASQELELARRRGRDSTSSRGCCRRCAAGDGDGRGARRRALPRAPGGAARCSSALAAEQPLVLVLDDLHWADDASVELLARAAAPRRRARPSCSRSAFRPGQAPERPVGGAGARPPTQRIVLAPLDEAEAAELLDGVEPDAVAAIVRHGGGEPVLPRAARAGRARRRRPPPRAATALGAGRRAGSGGRGAVARSSTRSRRARARCSMRAAVAGEPFEPDLAARVAGSAPGGRPRCARRPARSWTSCAPTPVPRRFAFRHPLVRQAVYESLRAAGGSPRTRALPRRSRRAARRRPSAPHHVEQYAAAQGDEAAIAVLLEAGDETLRRARPRRRRAGTRPRCGCCPARTASAGARSSSRSPRRCARAGELERCRTTLLEALDAAAAAGRRAPRRADGAVRRGRALAGPPRRRASPARRRLGGPARPRHARRRPRCRSSWRWTASTRWTSRRRVAMARDALATAQRLGDRGLIWPRPPRSALARRPQGETPRRAEHRELAVAELERLPDAELAPRLEALYYLGWAENYLERYDDAIAHAERGVALARATGQGRLLVPLMLVKGYPARDAGPARRGARGGEDARWRSRACRPTRTTSSGRSSSWAGRTTTRATSTARSRRARRACASAAALTRGTMPSAGGGPGWALGGARFEAGDAERGARDGRAARRRRPRTHDPRRALLQLGEHRAGRDRGGQRSTRPSATRRRPRRRRRARPQLPRGGSRRARARRCCWRRATREAARLRGRDGGAARDARRRDAPGRVRARPRRAGRSRRRASARRRSRCCARPSGARRAAARCASATRRAASCASWARGPSRAARPRPRTRGVGVAHQARARDRRARDRPHDEPRDRRGRSSSATRRSSRTCATSSSSSASSSRVDVARAIERERESGAGAVTRWRPRRGRRPPARAGLRAGARRAPARLRQRGARASPRSRRSSGCTRSCSSGTVGRRARVGVGAAGRARRAVPAPRRLLRAGVASSRSPAAPTSGRGA